MYSVVYLVTVIAICGFSSEATLQHLASCAEGRLSRIVPLMSGGGIEAKETRYGVCFIASATSPARLKNCFGKFAMVLMTVSGAFRRFAARISSALLVGNCTCLT